MADTSPPELNEARASLLHHAEDTVTWETLNGVVNDLQALDDRLASADDRLARIEALLKAPTVILSQVLTSPEEVTYLVPAGSVMVPSDSPGEEHW